MEIGKFGPVKLTSDKEFGKNNGENLKGAIFFPTAGYISDPQLSAHNLQRASEKKEQIICLTAQS